MHRAVDSKVLEGVRAELEHWSIDARTRDEHDLTALMFTAFHGDSDASLAIMRLLLSRGAAVNLIDFRGRTALHIAAEQEMGVEMIRMLVGAGADVRLRNHRGLTPLGVARRFEKAAAIAVLTELGAPEE